MSKVAVFIDGGYLIEVLRTFNQPRINYHDLVQWIAGTDELFRAYYYDCLPYQSPNPTEEERKRVAAKQGFFSALQKGPRFAVRQGRMAYRGNDSSGRPIFQQKRVDLMLGLDIATLVFNNRVDVITLASGGSDLIPAIEVAQDAGILVKLVHGPTNSFHRDLWDQADDRIEITQQSLQSLALPAT